MSTVYKTFVTQVQGYPNPVATGTPTPNPAPVITSLSPSSINQNSPDTAVTVTGTGFTAATVVKAGATTLATTYVSDTQLTAVVTAALMATAGTLSITATTAAPGGGTSPPATLTVPIYYFAPTLTSLVTATRPYFSGVQTIGLVGTGFTPASTATVDGVSTPVTYNSSTSLTLNPPASIHWPNAAFTNTRSIVVSNPTPGGGSSSAATYTLSAPTWIKVWYRADKCVLAGSFCTQLTDMSGNGYHTSVAAGTARPTYIASDLNGKAAILFDGAANTLNFAITTTSPWNWIASMSQETFSSARYIVGGTSAPGGGAACAYQTGTIISGLGFNSLGGGYASGQSPALGLRSTCHFIYNGASSDNVLNGRFALPALASAGTGTASAYSLGSNLSTATTFMGLKLREFVGASGTIPAADLLEYHAYRDNDDFGYASNAKIVNVVCCGDSITRGTGAPYGNNYCISNTAGPKFGLPVNKGLSGATALDMDNNFANTGNAQCTTDGLVTGMPNAVFVHIGINDILNAGRTPAQVITSLQSYYSKCRAWFTANLSAANAASSKVILLKTLAGKLNADSAGVQATKETNRLSMVSLMATNQATICDVILNAPAPMDALATIAVQEYTDNLHPNFYGQNVAFSQVGTTLRTLYGV